MEVLLKLLIIFSAILLISVLPVGVRASECDNPKPGWYFYSCWDYGLGSGQTALEDGVQPTANWHNWDHCTQCSVTDSLPAGAPDNGNALKVQYTGGSGPDCSLADVNNYVSQGIGSTNPFYERFYFYTTDPTAATAANGDFCGGYKFGRYMGNSCSNTAMYVHSDSPSGPSRIMIKNHGAGEEEYNTRTALHLTGTGDWPGKESDGVITPNVWHSYEYAVYRHDTEGWIKAWLDGKLVINASGSAFHPTGDYVVSEGGSGTYDTHKTMIIDGVEVECNEAEIQIPGFRNGGGNPAHTEYIKNLVVSTSYIGPIGTPSQTCAEAGGTCKTNVCSSYQSCSSLSGTCSSGYCCSGSCIQDTTPPSISSVSASSITSNSATVTWTTNEASDSQVEYGLTTSYGSQTALNTAMVTSHSQSLSGLSSSTTYHYRVKSRDAAGNLATSGDYTFTTTSQDTVSPTVSITSPTSGSTVSGSIAVSAAASDNVAVAGVQFRLDSQNLGSEDTTSPYSISWDTTLAANGSHTLTAVARDSSGNLNTSSPITITVTNQAQPQSGLVASYSFNEGSGTTAYDSSGNGNTGTLKNGPAWTTGKIGGALEFDGVDDSIAVAPSNSINNLGPVTIAFWTKLDIFNNGRFIDKGKTAGSGWSLRLNAADATTGDLEFSSGSVSRRAVFPSSPVGTWKFIAVTWDGSGTGSNIHMYLDGSEMPYSYATYDGTPADDSSQQLTLGCGYYGGCLSGSNLDGILDEVRIYSRVLSASEIQELYNAAPSCIHKSEIPPCDGCVNMAELTTFINRWKVNNSDVTLREMIEAIGLWKRGC